ncbi:MAG TPA: triphosphoribosyl-dephospho-CoA synthase [Thermoanaerobaculia bacterium]|nr:triphosphoribosyl-dephospho-CoA synthase [Thermoanaerobaculia bacterium]
MDIRREILRNVILCQSLEPLGTKPGVTSRIADASPGTKLEYFVISGVNSSWSFYDLADRVLREGRQPDCVFDAAYQAQGESVRNRLGSKVNYGQILLLVPLIVGQTLNHLEAGGFDDVEAILGRSTQVLKDTTEKDVEFLEKFVRLGYELSARHHERLGRPTTPPKPAFRKKYKTVWEAAHAHLHIHAVREMTEGYPHTERVYRFLLHNVDEGILQASDLIYRLLLAEIGRPDAVADIVVCGMYLALTAHPETVLFA